MERGIRHVWERSGGDLSGAKRLALKGAAGEEEGGLTFVFFQACHRLFFALLSP